MKTSRSFHLARFSGSRRGSLLIVAMLFAALIAISLGSYLRLSVGALRLSQRSFFDGAAMSIAEAGLEQAVWSFNQSLSGNTGAWNSSNGWGAASGNTLGGTFFNFTLPYGATGYVKVYVKDYNSTGVVSPSATALAVITPKTGGQIKKYIQITLRRRSRFATGVVGREQVTFNGNKTVLDSWNSVGSTGGTVTYGNSSRRSNGSVGSASITVGSLSIGNADVYGYLSTAGPTPQVGGNGTVGVWGDAVGTVKQDRIARDFAANFDDVAEPDTLNTLTSITGSITLPRTVSVAGVVSIGDMPKTIDGKVYYTYSVPDISLSGGNAKVTISDNKNVILVVTKSTGNAVQITGTSSIAIGNGGSLELYTAGDVSIAGNGVANGSNNGNGTNNMNPPINFQLWGTRPYVRGGTRQDIKIVGNGNLSGIVYAPFGDIKMAGSSSSGPGAARDDVFGSVVGYTVTMLGEESFHYDESLASFGGSAPFGVTKWREITSASDRATYNVLFNF